MMKFIQENYVKKIIYYIILFFMIIGSINTLIDSAFGYNFIEKINLLLENITNLSLNVDNTIYLLASVSAIIFHIIRIFFVLKFIE